MTDEPANPHQQALRNKQIAAAEKDKAYQVSMEKIEKEALAIQAGPKDPKDYLVQELDVLLKWHQVPMKDVPGKQKKIAKWSEIMGSTKPPPHFRSGRRMTRPGSVCLRPQVLR